MMGMITRTNGTFRQTKLRPPVGTDEGRASSTLVPQSFHQKVHFRSSNHLLLVGSFVPPEERKQIKH